MADAHSPPPANGSLTDNSPPPAPDPQLHVNGQPDTKEDEKVKSCQLTPQVSEEKINSAESNVQEGEKSPVKKAKSVKSPKKSDPCENGKVAKKSRVSRELTALMDIQLPAAVTDVTNSHSQVNGTSKAGRKSSKRTIESDSSVEPRVGKRVRLQHQPFQSPSVKMVHAMLKPPTIHLKKPDPNDDKIVVFNRGDFLAVRNESGSFYVCRTAQNVYKTSRKFKIQWLDDKSGHYVPDFFDTTDFECVLTNLRMNKISKTKYQLPEDEKQRALNILQRAINVERGVVEVPDPRQVAEDGVDVSILGKEEEKEVLEMGKIKSECKEKDEKEPGPSEKKSKIASKNRKSQPDLKVNKSKGAKKSTSVKEMRVEPPKKDESAAVKLPRKPDPPVMRTTRLARRSITEEPTAAATSAAKKSADVIKVRTKRIAASKAKQCQMAARRRGRIAKAVKMQKLNAEKGPSKSGNEPPRSSTRLGTTSVPQASTSSSSSSSSASASASTPVATATGPTEKKAKVEASVKAAKQSKVKAQPKPLSLKKSPSEIINNLLGLEPPVSHSFVNTGLYTLSSNSSNESNNQLLSSIICGDFKTACELIRSEKVENLRTLVEGKYLLIHAATHCPAAIPDLITAGVDVNCVDLTTGNTALHILAGQVKKSNESIAIASALLSANININASNKEGKSPLHISASAAYTDVDIAFVETLIEAGGDLSARDKLNRIPLYYAFIKLNKPEDTSFFDPVELATVLSCEVELAKVKDVFAQTPLHRAAFRGATVCCMYLMRKIITKDALDCNGNSALSIAAMNGHEGCVLALINGGCNFCAFVNRKPALSPPPDNAFLWDHVKQERIRLAAIELKKHKHTVVQEVMTRNWQRVVFYLLTHLSSDFSIAIEAGIKAGKLKLVHRLLSKSKSEFKCQSDLISVLCEHSSTDDSNELQEKILDTLTQRSIGDITGKTVLVAASNNHYFLCEELTVRLGVEKVASQAPDEFNHTPLTAMFINLDQQDVRKEMKTWASSLTSAGATFNTLSYYPIVESPYPGVRFLYCTLESKKCKYSPLIVAVLKQNYPMVKYLVQQKADINLKDELGRTALMHAARLNDLKMIKLLLNLRYEPETDTNPWNSRFLTFKQMSSADLKVTDNKGWTVTHHLVAPLEELSYHKSDVIIRLLAQVGAPLNLPDKNGLTPLHLATERNLRRVIETLQELIDDEAVKGKPICIQIPPFTLSNGYKESQEQPVDWKQHLPSPSPPPPTSSSSSSSSSSKGKGEKSISKCTIHADTLLGFGDSSEILMDADLNIPYSILLVKPDKDVYGVINFVKIQIVIHKERNLVVLFTRSGNVGEVGQHKKTTMNTQQDAIEEFQKVFTAKTGNNWSSIVSTENAFKPVAGKYRIFQALNKPVLKLDMESCQSSPLANVTSQALNSLLNNSTYALPNELDDVTILDDGALCKCDEILSTLEKLIEDKDNDLKGQGDTSSLSSKTGKVVEQIFDLSLELNNLLNTDLTERMKPILEKSDLHAKERLVRLIRDQHLCLQIMKAAKSRSSNNSKNNNKSDSNGNVNGNSNNISSSKDNLTASQYLKSCLHYQFHPLQYSALETQLILQWIHNSSLGEPPQVNQIWSLAPKSGISSEVIMTSHPNVWLLFYELPSVCDLLSCLCGQLFSIPNNLGKVCILEKEKERGESL